MPDPTPSEAIVNAINGVKAHDVDGNAVTNHSIPDLIAGARFAAAQAQAARGGFPGRRFKFRMPGASGVDRECGR